MYMTDDLPELSPERKPARDRRLDFWRGLCLMDMVIVHMVQQGMQFGALGQEVLADYTRFAAGGYILLSGMTVGFVFYPRVLDPARRWESYLRLWRRAAFIFAVHLAVTFVELLILGPLHGGPTPPLSQAFRDILLLREGYDLLPFYVIMVALSPLVLELMRRRLAWPLVLASIGLFVWNHWNQHYAQFALPITSTFYFGFWQILFLAGIFAGSRLKRYDALPARTKRATAGGFWLVSAVIFFAAFGHHFGLQKYGLGQHVMDDRPLSPLTFWKTPLTTGELLRYFFLVGAIVTTTDLLWRWLHDRHIAEVVNRMGRRSLAIYIAQGYLVNQVDKASDRIGGPWGVQFLWMLYMLALVWSIAWLLDVFSVFRLRLTASQGRALPVTS
jgi:hypothetical protein